MWSRLPRLPFLRSSATLSFPGLATPWPLLGRAAGAAGVGGGLVRPGYERLVGNWLISSSALLTGMVLIGGYTRLSGSGLSMVDWSLRGNWLPRGQAAWEEEFARYQKFPEYKKVYAPGASMTLDEFQRIYFVEWFHRQFGRFTGLFFAVPFVGLTAVGVLRPALVARLGCLAGLGLTQGLVGWWMVQSGLKEDLLTRPDVPRVSPYRMAFHWGMALTLFGGTLWTGLAVRAASAAAAGAAAATSAATASRLRRAMAPVLVLSALTLASGPFVAGNDAGRAFNRWPLMTETSMVPDEVKTLVTRASAAVWAGVPSGFPWQVLFEETGVVQFVHRSLAYGTVGSALGLGWFAVRRLGSAIVPRSALYWATRAVPMMAATQMCLGIATLLMYVPTDLALAHQAGGLGVFTTLLWLRFLVRK